MKPLRRVISSEHTLEFTLECGHKVTRKPFAGKRVIPHRIGCTQCQAEAFQHFDADQTYARGRNELAAEIGDAVATFANCLIFCVAKVLMPPFDIELDVSTQNGPRYADSHKAKMP